jgi:RNA polymerase sigma factor (sigma-70 family)
MAPQPQSRSRAREKRAKLLERLLRAERRPLMRQARAHSRRREDAEDALGDACVQFLRFYEGPEGDQALRWMLLVVKRCAWAIQRRAKAREAHYRAPRNRPAVRTPEAMVPDGRVGPAELIERSEETARLIEAIEQLKPDERTALILVGLGCTRAEVRELRGWSEAKLHRCLSEGRAQVRELLARGDG